VTPSERSIAIVTDSTSDLPRELAEEHGITVVPLNLTIGTETLKDGDLTQAEFFERMNASPQLPTTSQPSVGAFVDTYAAMLETAGEVVSIHISEHLSGTIESARAAAEQFGGKVHVFDSLNLSGGLAWPVLAAARAANEGATLDGVLRAAESARDRVRLIVGLDRLDNLAKGGRIGAVSAFLGGLLNLKVMLTVDKDGTFEPVARVRGARQALEHTIEWIGDHLGDSKRGSFLVLHALSQENAAWLRERIEATFDVVELHVFEVGVVIATHTGTGWGVAVLPAD